MLNTFEVSGSPLKRLLVRLGVWSLLLRTGLGKPLSWLRRRLLPAARRQERALERDFRRFQQQHGSYLASGCVASGAEKRLLVASLSDWITQVKLESILAKALQFRGYRPVIATFRHQVRGHQYHRLFGYEDFAFLDVRNSDRREAQAVARQLLRHRPGFRDVLAMEHEGAPVGRHVLSSIVSTLRSGTVAFDDPQVERMLAQGLVEAVLLTRAAERLVERVQPDLMLFLERGYVPYAPLFDAALKRRVPAIQYCHSHRTDAYVLKRYGAHNRQRHPFSLSPASWERVCQMPWSAEREADLMAELRGRYEQGQWFNRKFLQVGKKIKDADTVRAQLELDPRKKTAVIFSHVLWDATFFYGTNLFDDYEEWLVETVKTACRNPAVNWVVKLHPDYVWKMKKAGDTRLPPEFTALGGKVGTLPAHVKLLAPETDISTYSLFGVTDWCLTVRGTIGVEMPCFGIPVLTAGTGRYSGLGFTVDSASRAEYLERLASIQHIPPLTSTEVELARRHAFALLRLRPFPFTTFEMVHDSLDQLGHVLDHNVVLRTTSLEQLRDAPDLQAFARWADAEKDDDYLGTPE